MAAIHAFYLVLLSLLMSDICARSRKLCQMYKNKSNLMETWLVSFLTEKIHQSGYTVSLPFLSTRVLWIRHGFNQWICPIWLCLSPGRICCRTVNPYVTNALVKLCTMGDNSSEISGPISELQLYWNWIPEVQGINETHKQELDNQKVTSVCAQNNAIKTFQSPCKLMMW